MLDLQDPGLDCQAVIVDLDGTMVDTLGDFTEALNRMLADLPLPAMAAHAVKPLVGKGSEHLLRSVLAYALAQAGMPADAVEIDKYYPKAWERYQLHYRAINGQYAKVYPGVAPGLQRMRAQGLQMACLTNKPLAFAEQLLEAKGLRPYFDVVFGGDSFAHKKPHPLPLIKTCEALGSVPARTLVIGDSSNDAQAGERAGCPVVLVGYGYNHGQPIRKVSAAGYIDALTDLQVSDGRIGLGCDKHP